MKARSHQRICAWCHSGISEQRPVFLVGDATGHIVGPFHAGCAERVRLEKQMPKGSGWREGAQTFGEWPTIREETLPE